MDNYEYSELLKELRSDIQTFEGIVRPQEINSRLEEIAKEELKEDFWLDPKQASSIQQEKTKHLGLLRSFNNAKTSLDDASELFEIAKEEDDASMLEEIFNSANVLEKTFSDLEIAITLSGENDHANAIVTIHPGAGGTESQDWALMLYRMYLRWAQRKDFSVEILDYQDGEEAGIKDASFAIRGLNAYGYLQSESGIHRLVRISPFDSNARRHTSFCSVLVSPELDDSIDIDIEDKDLRIDTYRSSGAGGQHVNKTESAIRITHIPTGVVVQCQNDRSQHKNKATAFKMLKSRLYELEKNKQKNENTDEKSEIGWGHQIRSYVLTPYQQVKDNRTNDAFSNVDGILDGDLDGIINKLLAVKAKSCQK